MVDATMEPEILHDTVKGAAIFIADADIGALDNMKRILARDGYTIRSTHTSHNAIRTVEEISPDLMIIDVCLPEIGGVEVCRNIKSQERFRDTPVILVADIKEIAQKGRAFQAGASDWIFKPIEELELKAKINTHLKLSIMVKSSASQERHEKSRHMTDSERPLKKHCEHLEATVKERTAQLTIAKEQSKAANIAKKIFLSHMSHELRTPLNAILGFSRLMERDANLTEKQAENLDLIHQSGEHLLNLVNDVLAMAKTDAGHEALEITAIDLHQLIEGIAVMFNSRAVGRGLTFTLDMMPNIPRYVNCDERKLQHILTTLMNNSIKYTDTGGIELKVWSPTYDMKKQTAASKTRNGKLALYFEVRDSGKGIPPDKLETIFDPLFSNHTAGIAKAGTGLGLTISRNFARLMGGDITATNRHSKGALFTLHMTVELAPKPAEQVHYRVTGINSGNTGRRILVVDDNGTSRLLLSELLRDVGFSVEEAQDGRRAVALFFEWRPHLVFMDIRMPLMDGMAATRIIKATEEGRQVPVIALTAHAIEEERQKIIAAGCDAFIQKPFKESELFEVMAKHLELAFVLKKANQPQPKFPPPTQDPHRSIEAMAELPTSILDELKQSSLALDLEKINACINDIQTGHNDLGESLKSLAKGFRFNDIFKLTEEAIRIKK